ncbi:MAG: ABC transporter substrate-binding protein [Anaerolineae bacterium]
MNNRSFRVGTLPVVCIGLVILAYLAYAIVLPTPTKPDATWTRIKETGVLRIGIDPSFPPFAVDDGKGNLSGYDIALAQALAQRWGVRIQYVYTGFDGLYDALTGNQFDMILSALPYNPTKTQDVYFTHDYFNGGPVIVVAATDQSTRSLYDLTGRSVAVELGTGGDIFARRWQRRLDLNLREMNTTTEALEAVQRGQVGAAIVDPISFYDFDRAHPSAGRTVGGPLARESYAMAVRRDSPTLLRELNDALDAMIRDGSLQELQKKWF